MQLDNVHSTPLTKLHMQYSNQASIAIAIHYKWCDRISRTTKSTIFPPFSHVWHNRKYCGTIFNLNNTMPGVISYNSRGFIDFLQLFSSLNLKYIMTRNILKLYFCQEPNRKTHGKQVKQSTPGCQFYGALDSSLITGGSKVRLGNCEERDMAAVRKQKNRTKKRVHELKGKRH